MRVSNETLTKIPYFLLIILVIYKLQPSILFKPNGKLRVYGLGIDDEGYKKSLYTFQFIIVLIAIFITFFI